MIFNHLHNLLIFNKEFSKKFEKYFFISAECYNFTLLPNQKDAMTKKQIIEAIFNGKTPEQIIALGREIVELGQVKLKERASKVDVEKIKDGIYRVSSGSKAYELKQLPRRPRNLGFVVYSLVPGANGKLKRGPIVKKEYLDSVWNFRNYINKIGK